MRILIATASRHGATHEIGDRLGSAVRRGMSSRNTPAEVDIRDVDDVDAVADYDAVVLGSAVYMGRWLRSARRLAEREFPELETRPVWLFSSGPIGENQRVSKAKWDNASWAVEHKTFGGKLERSTLSRSERLVVRMIKAQDGDDRPWSEIDAWADRICSTLAARAVVI